MWFLLTQIFVLMLLAAMLGAWLAWWWTQRHFEDVTETHVQLADQARQFDLSPIQSRLAGMDDKISAFRPAETDLTPLSTRLDTLEASLSAPRDDIGALKSDIQRLIESSEDAPGIDLEPLKSRLSGIEDTIEALDLGAVHSSLALMELAIKEQEFPQTDLSHVHAHIESLEAKLEALGTRLEEKLEGGGETDLSPVFERMSGVERAVVGLQAPEVDLSGLTEQLNRLEEKVAEPVVFDVPTSEKEFETLNEKLKGMENAISTLNFVGPDLTPIEQRMAALEDFLQSPNPDFDILHTRLTALESSIAALDRPAADMTPIYSRFASLDAAIQSLRLEQSSQPVLDNLEHRLAALQDTVMRLPQQDMGAIINAMRSIEARMDPGALEDRLTAIEYGLAAMHQMLRTRPEPQQAYVSPPDYLRQRPAPPPTYATPPRPQPPRQTYPAPPPPPPLPQRQAEIDPLQGVRRPGDEANLLTNAAFGEADDLELVNGIGPMLGSLLNDIGVFYYWQIAEWSPENVDYVDGLLKHFRGRITRDNWVGQARSLAAQPSAARKPGAGSNY